MGGREASPGLLFILLHYTCKWEVNLQKNPCAYCGPGVRGAASPPAVPAEVPPRQEGKRSGEERKKSSSFGEEY